MIALSFTASTIATAQVIKDSVSNDNIKTDSVPTIPANKDTVPSSVNIQLENIFNSKQPKKYTISKITVTGTTFDPNLIISISGLAVGDKVILPGSDDFANAITNLWKQNLVSDVEIYLTELNGSKSADAIITYWLTPPYASGHCWQPHKAIILDTDNGYRITNEEFIPDNFAIDSVLNKEGHVTIYGYDYDCGDHKVLKYIRARIK